MTAFIVDRYNRFDQWDREHTRYVFELNEQWYGVKEVYLKWGKPQLPLRIGDNRDCEEWEIYDTLEDAMRFVHLVKGLNAR